MTNKMTEMITNNPTLRNLEHESLMRELVDKYKVQVTEDMLSQLQN